MITLTDEEVEALIAYFNETTINLTALNKKIGLKKLRVFESALDKLYKSTSDDTGNKQK